MNQSERISDLNKFFSKVNYDFYNIPMAILLCFYNNKFQPVTYNEILKEILSRKDSKIKLRKATGEEYTGLELAIKNLLNNRKKLFKKIIDEENNEPKYLMILDNVQRLWEFTLISKKTKRKNFASDEESKEKNLAGFSIYHPKGYKSYYKTSKTKRSRSRNRSRRRSKSNSRSDNSSDDNKENILSSSGRNNARSKSMEKLEKINKNGYLSDGLGKNDFHNRQR